MPIKGLTDGDVPLSQGLVEFGTLHKGAEKGENRPGKDLDFFRVTFKPNFAHLCETWQQLYGLEPDCFSDVFVPGQTLIEVFDSWNEEYDRTGDTRKGATTLTRRCDGDAQVKWWDGLKHQHSPITCERLKSGQCGCKPIGRLKLIFTAFSAQVEILGYFMLTLTSIHDIRTVYGSLMTAERMVGTLAGVRFIFGRAPESVNVPKGKGGGERIKTEKSLLFMYAHPDAVRGLLLPAMTQAALPAPQLPARTITVIGATGEIIDDEPNEPDDEPDANVWPSKALVEEMLDRVITGLNPNATAKDVARWAGITDITSVEQWRKFPTRGDAAKTIKLGFEADKVFGTDEADQEAASMNEEDAILGGTEDEHKDAPIELTDEVRSARYEKRKVFGAWQGVVILETNSGATVEMRSRNLLRKVSPAWKAYVEKWQMGTDGAGNKYEFAKADPPLPFLLVTYKPDADQYQQVKSITAMDIDF